MSDKIEEKARELCNYIQLQFDEDPTFEMIEAGENRIAAALRAERAMVDELFVLDVDCELGSGCLKDRTCSGASHWQTVEEIRAKALEEAAVMVEKRKGIPEHHSDIARLIRALQSPK